MNILFILFIPFSLSEYLTTWDLSASSDCKKYSCATSSTKKKYANSCVYSPSGSASVYLWTCPIDSTANYCNLTSGTCQVPQTSAHISYVGESCKTSSDCILSTCIKSICRGLGRDKSCTSHEQCDMGFRCNIRTLTCQPQIPVNETGCRSYLDCVNWATCNSTYSTLNGTCYEYHSLPVGSVVTDCVNSFSYLCKSGYCTSQFAIGRLGVCVAAPVSYNIMPKICSSNLDCIARIGTKNITSTCSCGFNSLGSSYCSPMIGDLPGVTMIYSWKSALKLAGNCNTARRGSDGCLRSIQKLGNVTRGTLGFYNYARYVSNDLCVKYIYNYQYWYGSALALMPGLVLLFFN